MDWDEWSSKSQYQRDHSTHPRRLNLHKSAFKWCRVSVGRLPGNKVDQVAPQSLRKLMQIAARLKWCWLEWSRISQRQGEPTCKKHILIPSQCLHNSRTYTRVQKYPKYIKIYHVIYIISLIYPAPKRHRQEAPNNVGGRKSMYQIQATVALEQ
jgi:hypothetical protein